MQRPEVLFSKFYIEDEQEYRDAVKRLLTFGPDDEADRIVAFNLAKAACLTTFVLKIIKASVTYNGVDHVSYTSHLIDKDTCKSLMSYLMTIKSKIKPSSVTINNVNGFANPVDVDLALTTLTKYKLWDEIPVCLTFQPSCVYAILACNQCDAAKLYRHLEKNGPLGTPVFLIRRLAVMFLLQKGIIRTVKDQEPVINEDVINVVEAVIGNYYNINASVVPDEVLLDRAFSTATIDELLLGKVPVYDLIRKEMKQFKNY